MASAMSGLPAFSDHDWVEREVRDKRPSFFVTFVFLLLFVLFFFFSWSRVEEGGRQGPLGENGGEAVFPTLELCITDKDTACIGHFGQQM